MVRADLHMHSDRSDGVLSPEKLVQEAARANVTIMAVTDHDTFAGVDSLRGMDTPVPVIPGVELSMRDMPGLHLLGYGLAAGTELRAEVARLAEKRRDRAKEMLRRLGDQGFSLDWEQLSHACHGTVGRPHIARAMVRAGYVGSMQEAFDRYIGHGHPAYVAGERLDMETAIALMRRSGFIPVLAHPCELKQEDPALLALVSRWKDMGLLGMEVYHPSARSYGFERLERMARRLGMLVTGGSDFHQEHDKHARVGAMADAWTSAENDVAALMQAMQSAR